MAAAAFAALEVEEPMFFEVILVMGSHGICTFDTLGIIDLT